MADEQINVKITGDYDDTDAKKAITDAEQIEKLDPELTITADDKASDNLQAVGEKAEALSREEAEIIVRAQIDAAKADLERLESKLREVSDTADDTNRHLDRTTGGGGGPNVRGQAIADLTGPLGQASGAASDFAGVFDGIADISEGVAARVGVSAATMTSAITGIGVAVAAGAALWTVFRQKQEEAKRKQKELIDGQREMNEALDKGDIEAWGRKFIETYADVLDAGEQVGVSVGETTKLITGQADALPQLNAQIDAYTAQIDSMVAGEARHQAELILQRQALIDVRDQITGAADDYDNANGSLDDQEARLRGVTGAMSKAKRETQDFATAQDRAEESTRILSERLDGLRGGLDIEQSLINFKRDWEAAFDTAGEDTLDTQEDVLALKQTVVDVGDQFKRSPLEIQTVLEQIDEGDLIGARNAVNAWFRMNPVIIASRLDRPLQTGGGRLLGGGIVQEQNVGAAVAPMTVNVNMPRGSRGVDVLRQVSGQARRSGRRYGVPVIHFARAPL